MSHKIWDHFDLETSYEINAERSPRRRKAARAPLYEQYEDWIDAELEPQGKAARWSDFDPEHERRRRKLGRPRRRSDD